MQWHLACPVATKSLIDRSASAEMSDFPERRIHMMAPSVRLCKIASLLHLYQTSDRTKSFSNLLLLSELLWPEFAKVATELSGVSRYVFGGDES
jgi:hypothetical protein